MAEILTLSTPIAKPSVTTVDVLFLGFDWGNSRVTVRVKFSDSTEQEFTYGNSVAATMMSGLNSANLSTKSLYKRVVERLQADGKLPAGTITGTPA